MTTEAQVRSWAAQGESENQEFKETTGLRVEACQTLCGFLNRNGGRVLFGVTNAGVVRGQDVTEATLEKIAGETQRLDPPAFPGSGTRAARERARGRDRNHRARLATPVQF